MGVFDPKPQKKSELPEEGKHPAVLYLIADLGSHKDTYEGKETIKRKVYISFELVGTKMEDGRPFVIGEEFTVSPSKFGGYYISATSNLFKLLKSWGDVKDCRKDLKFLSDLLNSQHPASVFVGIVDKRNKPGEKKAIIESVKPYKGSETLARVNPPVDAISNPEDFEKLPVWIKKRIEASLERNGGIPVQSSASTSYVDDESIPF